MDGPNPVEVDEPDLIVADPLPSYVWYQDLVDFADGISDRARGILTWAQVKNVRRSATISVGRSSIA